EGHALAVEGGDDMGGAEGGERGAADLLAVPLRREGGLGGRAEARRGAVRAGGGGGGQEQGAQRQNQGLAADVAPGWTAAARPARGEWGEHGGERGGRRAWQRELGRPAGAGSVTWRMIAAPHGSAVRAGGDGGRWSRPGDPLVDRGDRLGGGLGEDGARG